VNWVHYLLPYIKPDSKELLDQMGKVRITPLPNGTAVQTSSINGQIKVLICPSDLSDGDLPERLSYACNGGRPDQQPNPQYLAFDWPANGVFCNRLHGRQPDPHKIDQMTPGDIRDGESNTIMLAENVNVSVWNQSPAEYHACIVWRDPAGPTLTEPWPMIGLNKDFINTPADYAHARPSSYHPNGFMIVKCDGSTQFVAATIQYHVYMKLMSSHGTKYLEPGLPPSASNPISAIQAFQSAPLSEDEY
jgi:hypothetical protein